MDVWFFVRDNGEIVRRTELDGWAYLRARERGGPYIMDDTVVTEEWVKEHHPGYYETYLKRDLERIRQRDKAP